jgi:hypothetical protein
MSSLVGPVVVGGYSQEKVAIPEKLGGPHTSSAMDPSFSLEQHKPQGMSILF